MSGATQHIRRLLRQVHLGEVEAKGLGSAPDALATFPNLEVVLVQGLPGSVSEDLRRTEDLQGMEDQLSLHLSNTIGKVVPCACNNKGQALKFQCLQHYDAKASQRQTRQGTLQAGTRASASGTSAIAAWSTLCEPWAIKSLTQEMAPGESGTVSSG